MYCVIVAQYHFYPTKDAPVLITGPSIIIRVRDILNPVWKGSKRCCCEICGKTEKYKIPASRPDTDFFGDPITNLSICEKCPNDIVMSISRHWWHWRHALAIATIPDIAANVLKLIELMYYHYV